MWDGIAIDDRMHIDKFMLFEVRLPQAISDISLNYKQRKTLHRVRAVSIDLCYILANVSYQ